MGARLFRLSIIIPTKNRVRILTQLLESISRLEDVGNIRPEIIVADNGSDDNTNDAVASMATKLPSEIRIVNVPRPGKSAAINDAVKTATGDVLAFLDDDVVVDESWLTAVAKFFREGKYHIGQGLIRLQSNGKDDPEVIKLVQRYRTIPQLEYQPNLEKVHSLNGANFFVSRDVFDRVGGFDERLGPGASGTSEDVDFARRVARAGIVIGYVPQAIVYHHVDRERLTDDYFKQSHWSQGVSRFLIRKRSSAEIILNLLRACAQYGVYTLVGKERDRYRSKGRIYHYLGMMDAKRNQTESHRTR